MNLGQEGSQHLFRALHALVERTLVLRSTFADLRSNPDFSTSCVALCISLTSVGLSIFVYKVGLLTLT